MEKNAWLYWLFWACFLFDMACAKQVYRNQGPKARYRRSSWDPSLPKIHWAFDQEAAIPASGSWDRSRFQDCPSVPELCSHDPSRSQQGIHTLLGYLNTPTCAPFTRVINWPVASVSRELKSFPQFPSISNCVWLSMISDFFSTGLSEFPRHFGMCPFFRFLRVM